MKLEVKVKVKVSVKIKVKVRANTKVNAKVRAKDQVRVKSWRYNYISIVKYCVRRLLKPALAADSENVVAWNL